jgi:hypothetical protein
VERLTVLAHSASDYAAMARAPSLARVGTLDLRRNNCGPAGARALANSPRLTDLCGLVLAKNGLGRQGLAALTGSEHLTGLVHLDLEDNGLDPASVGLLGDWPERHDLFRLSLKDNPLGGNVLNRLLDGGPPERLRALNLSNTGTVLADVLALSAAEMPLRELDLSRNAGVDASCLDALFRAVWIGELERLDLGYTGMSADVAYRIGERELPRLRELVLTGVPCRGGSIEDLARSPRLPALKLIDVRSSGYDGDRTRAEQAKKRGVTIRYR